MSTIRSKKAIDALQTRYLIKFAVIAVLFALVYILYLMGKIDYFHAWLMRGIVLLFILSVIYVFITYLREKATLMSGATARRR